MRTKLGVLSVLLGLAILGTSWWVIDSGRVRLEVSAAKPTATISLPPCPDLSAAPLLPVTAEWQQVISDYYALESLTVRSFAAQAQLLDVGQQQVGLHPCRDGLTGQVWAYQGLVPAGATAAVRVPIDLDTADIAKTPVLVTLASWGNGWRVVAETSGP